jgi:lysyl-tRNA synthetase class 2
MLEWYRAGEPYQTIMDDAVSVLREAAKAAGSSNLVFRGVQADPFAGPERLTVADAFARFAGIDILASLTPTPDRDRLAGEAAERGVRTASDDTWSDIFSRILSAKVEPNLGSGRVTLLDQYPAVEAALARTSPSDQLLAERFELYACGVELANGFAELTDAAEQRRRFVAEMDEKERVYGERYPIDQDFLDALSIMPSASGIALGLDRLVMLATGAPSIDGVQWTPASGDWSRR